MTNKNILQGPPYDLSQIHEEEILFAIISNFPANLYFFIWRCCEEKDDLRFTFTLPVYYDSKFQKQTVNHLSRLGLVNPINWDGPHVGIEKLVASDIRISKKGKEIFQNWLEVGLVEIIIHLPHNIRRNVRNFNNYFYHNFRFSQTLEKGKFQLSEDKLLDDMKFYSLDGPKEHYIKIVVEYKQMIIRNALRKKLKNMSVLISCGFCQNDFVIVIKPKTFNKYKTYKKLFKIGCPNCRYPQQYRTRFFLDFYNKKFEIERFLANHDKELLYNEKFKIKNEIIRRFKIFTSNNIFNTIEKQMVIRNFEEELDEKWDELKVHSILFNEFLKLIEEFYLQKKNGIKSKL